MEFWTNWKLNFSKWGFLQNADVRIARDRLARKIPGWFSTDEITAFCKKHGYKIWTYFSEPDCSVYEAKTFKTTWEAKFQIFIPFFQQNIHSSFSNCTDFEDDLHGYSKSSLLLTIRSSINSRSYRTAVKLKTGSVSGERSSVGAKMIARFSAFIMFCWWCS